MTGPTPLPMPQGEDLPRGFRVRLSGRTRVCDGGAALVGGTSGRVLYLAPAAAALVSEDREVAVTGVTSRRLARLLLDRGMADPCWTEDPPPDAEVDDVTVVVPVLDRAESLGRLLAALPASAPVVVVDDGSRDLAAVAAVAAAYDAKVVRHERNRGPAAARNTGLAHVATAYAAFVDSDVVPEPGWLGRLRRHGSDPAVALVAPRVLGSVERPDDSWLQRYEQARSSLDLGPDPAGVRPRGAVAYVPSACLLGRVDALGAGFDEGLRSGEDVDLVWRLVEAGWRVRYEPTAHVRHEHRDRLGPWLARKAFYGESAAPLAERHADAVAPMVLSPWSAVLTGALLAQRRWSIPVATAAWGVATAGVARRLDRSVHPRRTAATLTLEGAVAVVWQTSAALTRHFWPVAAVLALRSRRVRRVVAVAALADGLADHRRRRPRLDPVRYVVARRLDDLAYGAGLWRGVVRRRSIRALLPRWQG